MSKRVSLPTWEPNAGGLVCWRDGQTARVNIPIRIHHHSPEGPAWGYAGSGPADLALAVCHLVYPVGCDGHPPERLWKGKCSAMAWLLHQHVKDTVICRIPWAGGIVSGPDLRRAMLVASCRVARTHLESCWVAVGLSACYHVRWSSPTAYYVCRWCDMSVSLDWSAPDHVLHPVAEFLAEHPFSCEGAARAA